MKKLMLLAAAVSFLCLLLAQVNPEWEWVKNAGSSTFDFGNSIAVDSLGNSYLTGSFTGTAQFGIFSFTSNGESDIYVAKLDSLGNWLWVTQAGGTLADAGNGIAVDANGNVYVTGYFQNEVEFGLNTMTSFGSNDAFVSKLDSNGNWLWTVQAGGNTLETGYAIAVDKDGYVHVAGQYFSSPTAFGAYNINSSGYGDVFAAKLDSNGNWLWVAHGGGSGNDICYDITTDLDGNSIVTGKYIYLATFGAFSFLCLDSSDDIFIAKADPNGNWLWANSAGGSQPDCGYGISCDLSGDIYATGTFRVTSFFGADSLTMNVNNDLYVTKLSSGGDWLWARRAGGNGLDYGYSICTDNTGCSFVTGYFNGTADFGSHIVTSSGGSDIFVSCLDSSGNWLWAMMAGGISNDAGKRILIDNEGYCRVSGNAYGASYSFGSTALTGYGQNDAFAAKVSVPPLPPLALPFLEDWSGGSLYTNFWTAESLYWQISSSLGNPIPSVIFQSEPDLVNYDYALTSHEFDGTSISSARLKFDLDYDYSDWLGNNLLILEIWDGAVWTPLDTYAYYNVTEPTTFFMDISSYAVGNIFKIRFRADGADGGNFNYWMIDNIRIEEIPAELDAPQNFTMFRSGDYVYLDWDPVAEADWYALYIAFDAYGPFYYGTYVDASITTLEGEITPDMDPMLFFRITAGAGDPPAGARLYNKQPGLNRSIIRFKP
jgi:hypothetical protein